MDTALPGRGGDLATKPPISGPSQRGNVPGVGCEARTRPWIHAYLSRFAGREDALLLRRQKALFDRWAADSSMGPVPYLIGAGHRDPRAYVDGFPGLIGYAQRHIDVALVDSIVRFADGPAMAMRAAVALACFGVRDCKVGSWPWMLCGCRALSKESAIGLAAGAPTASSAVPSDYSR